MQNKRFYLPRAAYEVLPLLYLGFGLACLLVSQSIPLSLLAACLIARGMYLSILRINYRSPHQALAKSPVRRRDK